MLHVYVQATSPKALRGTMFQRSKSLLSSADLLLNPLTVGSLWTCNSSTDGKAAANLPEDYIVSRARGFRTCWGQSMSTLTDTFRRWHFHDFCNFKLLPKGLIYLIGGILFSSKTCEKRVMQRHLALVQLQRFPSDHLSPSNFSWYTSVRYVLSTTTTFRNCRSHILNQLITSIGPVYYMFINS